MLKDSSENSDKTAQNYGPVSAIVVTLAAYLGSQLFAGLLIGLYIVLTGKNSEFVSNSISNTTTGQFIFMSLAQLSLVGIIFWFVRRRKIPLSAVGLSRGPSLRDLKLAAIFFPLYMLFTGYFLTLVNGILPVVDLQQEQQLGFEAAQGFLPLLMVFISLAILPPIVEEIMVRGFLYGGLRAKLTKWIAALVASLLFGVAHLQLGSGAPPLYSAAIDTFLLSLVLIYLREKTGSLWSGIIIHGLKNSLAFIVLFVLNVR